MKKPAMLAANARFHPETFFYSLEETVRGWRKAPIEPSPAKYRNAFGVLPANSPAPLMTLTLSAWIKNVPLTIKPSRLDLDFARAWIDFAELDVKVVEEVDLNRDCVIVYGTDETVEKFRRPNGYLGYGHKFSVGYVEADEADACARDIIPWDQSGCRSPQTLFVRGDAEAFARQLADRLAHYEILYPRRMVDAATSLAIRTLRADVSLREDGRVFASQGSTAWTVLYDPSPAIEFTPLDRTVWVRGVSDRAEMERILAPHRHHLAVVGGIDVPLGEMQSPPFEMIPL